MALYYSDENNNLHKVAGNFYLPDNIERVETIYDKDSNDPNINWGYTSGIIGNSVIQRDISKYKKLIAYVATNITEVIYYSPTQVILDLTSLAPQNGRYRSMQTIQNYYSGWADKSVLPELATTLFEASLGKDDISFYTNLQTTNSTTHISNRETFVIYKIEGVY